MDFIEYEFEMHEGMPPDGESGAFYGFEKGGQCWLMRWSVPRKRWFAVTFEPAHKDWQPRVWADDGDMAGKIIKHARAPWDEPI